MHNNLSISVQTTLNTIREHIFTISQLFFLKRDLTGPMGVLRRFPTDIVNIALDELINYGFIKKGRKLESIIYSHIFSLMI